MKKTALFLATLLIAAGVGFAGDNPLIGTWELVSITGSAADGTKTDLNATKDGLRSIKIYGKTHYAVVTQAADGTFSNASAGTYVVKDKTFTETLRNSSLKDSVGTEWVHEYSISGDLLTNTWSRPNGAKSKEVWKRVE